MGAKVLVAMRANARCPACGVAVRFGFWPRTLHSVVGDLALLVGFVAALHFQTPVPFCVAAASWFGFALAIPMAVDQRDPISRRIWRRRSKEHGA